MTVLLKKVRVLTFQISEHQHYLQVDKIPNVSDVLDGIVKNTGGSWQNFILDMSICRLGLGLGLKFEKFTFDWMFLSQIKACKCMSYSKVSLSWKCHDDWASGSWDIGSRSQSQSQSQHENWLRCSCLHQCFTLINFPF